MIELLNRITENLQIVGLFYDVVGVLVLGLPIGLRGVSQIAKLSATSWTYNRAQAEDFAVASVDAFFGTLLMSVGFVLQLLPLLCPSLSESWTQCLGLSFFLGLPVALALYRLCLRRCISGALAGRVHRHYEKAEERRRTEGG